MFLIIKRIILFLISNSRDFIKSFSQELLSGNKGKGTITVFDDDKSGKNLSTDMILNTRNIYSVVLAQSPDGKRISYGLDGDGMTLSDEGRIMKLDAKGDTINGWDKKWISIGKRPYRPT